MDRTIVHRGGDLDFDDDESLNRLIGKHSNSDFKAKA
jgi:hypothetical protein